MVSVVLICSIWSPFHQRRNGETHDTSINDIPPFCKEFVYVLNESTSTLANESKQAGTLKVLWGEAEMLVRKVSKVLIGGASEYPQWTGRRFC
jgi:hypothetical protein